MFKLFMGIDVNVRKTENSEIRIPINIQPTQTYTTTYVSTVHSRHKKHIMCLRSDTLLGLHIKYPKNVFNNFFQGVNARNHLTFLDMPKVKIMCDIFQDFFHVFCNCCMAIRHKCGDEQVQPI